MRRRVAALSAIPAILATFTATLAVGLGQSQSAGPGAGGRQAQGSPLRADPEPSRGSTTAARERPRAADEQDRPRAAAPARGRRYARVIWRDSKSVGRPNAGALVRATKLPAEGRHFFSWDPELKRSSSPAWRRYATDRLIRVVLRVTDDFARANPRAPRLAIGDLSRPHGGTFGARYSRRLLHASHQNGLDVDVYYPRRDRRERAPLAVRQIDVGLAQDLVDRFVRAGAQRVFVGPNTRLTGPRAIVQAWPRHDNHLHVRLPPG